MSYSHSEFYPADDQERVFPLSQFQPGMPTQPRPPFQQPGGSIFPGQQPGGPFFQPGQPPTMPGTPGQPSQLSQAQVTSILSQHQGPAGQAPQEMLTLYSQLKSNPTMLQAFTQQRPQSLQQGVQLAQFGVITPSIGGQPGLPRFCYNRWTLVFTLRDVFLMFPVTNFFGFVIGYCYPFLRPCVIPNFQILFAFC
ncbi:hypothetical protein [Bacillus horti]|uniref:Uncharacterized protein n=1 Tax=Caldalkalibacillus horti TaxID=77523 RepID=A0ABT9W0I5_9BACI|nr:hypothetical protein [Bacillus horti]MDQ0166741.1 hypothetical protein [Bacillus horti]